MGECERCVTTGVTEPVARSRFRQCHNRAQAPGTPSHYRHSDDNIRVSRVEGSTVTSDDRSPITKSHDNLDDRCAMKNSRRIATGAFALALMAGAGAVTAGQANAAPAGCSIYDYRHGVSANCPPGSRYVVELDCFGLGLNNGETAGVRIFYHRTSRPADRTGFASVDCGQGSYIGIGLVTGTWIRYL